MVSTLLWLACFDKAIIVGLVPLISTAISVGIVPLIVYFLSTGTICTLLFPLSSHFVGYSLGLAC